ncbi:MAG: type II CAAX endopeptidase family protein [Planctomycetota bacterium]|nr:type II CAAX endopeptidase family protein [Planctomycetota bacterium]
MRRVLPLLVIGSFWVFPVSLVIAGDQSVTPAEVAAATPPEDPVFSGTEPWLMVVTGSLALFMTMIVLARRLWVLPTGTGPSWSGRAEFLLGAWIAMLLSTLIGATLGIRVFEPTTELSEQAAGMLGSYLVQSILMFIILIDQQRGQADRTPIVQPLRLRSVWGWALLGAVIAFPVSQSMGMVAGYIQSLFSSEQTPILAHDTLVMLSRDPLGGWAMLISFLVIFVTPCLEEFAYRGLLQQGFRKLGAGRWSAILLTSLMFVFMHVPNIDGGAMAVPVVVLLSLSLMLGWLYERTGRLLAPILVHGLFNGFNLLFMTLTL